MKKRSGSESVGPLVLKRPSVETYYDENVIEEEDDEDLDDAEPSQELPTFKPVNLNKDLFFDAVKGQYVQVDNFAFADHTNHFEDKNGIISDDTSSSLALLDSRIFDETTTNSCLDDSKIIVEELKRHLERQDSDQFGCSSTNDSSQPNSLDVSLDQDNRKPKIISPRGQDSSPSNALRKQRKKSSSSLRKLSSGESEKLLPSKDSSSKLSSEKKFAKQVQKSASSHSSPLQKKLNLDKSAKKLGQNKSHSATNLHKISVRDYHESFTLRRRLSAATSTTSEPEPNKSASFDSLYHLSWKELAGKKAAYSHVQSKVRQYIYSNNSSKPISQSYTDDDSSDIYGKSFVLSPGRKSLSMSNIVQEDQGRFSSQTRRRSSLKSELKSFLSAKNLNDMSISLVKSGQSQSSENLCYNHDKVDKLLIDDVSDHDPDADFPDNPSKVMVEVEDLLQMAIEERRGKIEAKTCLAELQMKHDELQKKYAAAEITIDNMRFGAAGTDENVDDKSQDLSLDNVFYQHLSDIQEQLYGLELLNSNALSSFSSTEKKSILNKLRSSFTHIQEEMSKDRVNNVELAQLLSDVGDKLGKMEDDEVDYETFAKTVPHEAAASIIQDKTVQSSEELDPIEKVANWRKEVHKTSTGYNSYSTSPTPGGSGVKNSERSTSFDQGYSPVELDSGCPGSERSPMINNPITTVLTRHLSHVAEEEHSSSSSIKTENRFHTITDLSSEEKIDAEIAQLKENLVGHTTAGSLSTPRGSNAVWAQQIEQEVVELRNIYEDHREEMMSILSHEKQQKLPPPMTSTGCSPIDFLPPEPTSALSSPRKSRKNKARQQQLVSDSDQDGRFCNLQEERRQEFEKFKKKRMKIKQQQQSSQSCQPKFAIGQAVQDVSISALFPQVNQTLNNEATEEKTNEGRHVATVDGDQVFIPKLNLEDQWSIEEVTTNKTVVGNPSTRSRRKQKSKREEFQSFFQTLHIANETAGQLKQRSQALLNQLQKELDSNMVY